MKALIIEPSSFFQKLISEQIRSFAMEVTVVESGIKSLELLSQGYTPDLICISLVTLDLPGPVIARQIHNLLGGKLPQLVLMTSATDINIMDEAKISGMNEIFNKSDLKKFRDYLHHQFSPQIVPRILYVEDSKVVMKLVLKHLSTQNWEVETAQSETEAWEKFQKTAFDLVLTDYHLGEGLNGLDLLKKIRNSPGGGPPVILVSGVEEKDARIAIFQAGADDLVMKPVIKEELLARTKVWIKVKQLENRVAQLEALTEKTLP